MLDKILTKLNIAILGTFLLIISSQVRYVSCDYASNAYCYFSKDLANLFLFYSIPILVFCAITAFMSVRVHKPWAVFTAIYLPVASLFVALAPHKGGGFSADEKVLALIAVTGLYVALSILIILIQSVRVYWPRRQM